MGFTLDHADIIGPISNGQSDGLLVFLHQLNNLSLLQRGDSAADHRLTHARCPQQLQLQVLLQCKGLRTEEKDYHPEVTSEVPSKKEALRVLLTPAW